MAPSLAVAASSERVLFLDMPPTAALHSETIQTALQQPVGQLIAPVFSGGRLAFRSHVSPFSECTPDVPAGGQARCIDLAHAKGVEVYAFVDALRWSTVGPAGSTGILARHPEMAERDLDGACGEVGAGAYASPCNPKVRAALVSLVSEIGRRYPTLDGLVLRCALPADDLLGYSQAARAAYIQAAGVDPVEIPFGEDPDSSSPARAWAYWPVTQMGALVKALAGAFRQTHAHGEVAVLADALWYRKSMAERNRTLNDWMDWALHCGIDEVILTGPWDGIESNGLYTSLTTMARCMGVQARLTVLLNLQSQGAPCDPVEHLAAQQGAYPLSLALSITNEQDLPRAASFWSTSLPQIQEALGPDIAPAGPRSHADSGTTALDPLAQQARATGPLTTDQPRRLFMQGDDNGHSAEQYPDGNSLCRITGAGHGQRCAGRPA
jgi:hypothetical protein